MKKIILILIFLLSVLAVSAEWEDFYLQVTEFYDGIYSLQADLVQENYWKEIDTRKSSQGHIYYNPDSLLISYGEPDGQQLYVLQDDILIIEPNAAQAIWMDKSDFRIKPQEILYYYWSSATVELVSHSEKQKIFCLTSSEETLEVILDDLFIRSVQITDLSGNSVKYTFRNERLNEKLPAGIFIPVIPKDASIIDNRSGGKQ